MRFPILTFATALCLALPTTAQEGTKKPTPTPASAKKIQVFGGQSTRACSTVVMFGDDVMAGICITHGQPEWQDSYDGMLDKLKGKINRLGKDLWTTFMTSTDITLGGVKVPAGSYVVGLHCDDAGTFGLALLDASKAMKKGLLPFGAQDWTPDVLVPCKLNKDASDSIVSKMTMTLAADKNSPSQGTFTLAWGKHTLTAAMTIPAVQ